MENREKKFQAKILFTHVLINIVGGFIENQMENKNNGRIIPQEYNHT